MEEMGYSVDKACYVFYKMLNKKIIARVVGIITHAMLDAIYYLSTKIGTVHGNIKTSNILFNEYGEVKLSDYDGFTRRLRSIQAQSRDLGCPYYKAPEQIKANPATLKDDIRSDVWSIGVCMLEMLLGSNPYSECKNIFDFIVRVVHGPVPLSVVTRKDILVPELVEYISHFLIKEIEQRPYPAELMEHRFYHICPLTSHTILYWCREVIIADNARVIHP
ncbi:dual specificity mitogen-activated protein kinase kinase 7-like [Corticium candelabrum]|uniref:dual specificity mitogen-activated protein kinase kinase 7-like n=1 Tax=Corticium candelabrum TaxID=121492 RepID=UPI002E254079|nr:dual specificity mitogen-activated protein kinase kinase 7-like [Corticium candelabrum]